MVSISRTRLVGERGSAVVQVAVALMVFTTLSAFVIDYGIQVVARSEIQNATDAAALAGASALAYENYSDRSATGAATTAAVAMAGQNLVREQQLDATTADVTFPVCESSYEAAASGSPKLGCVQVTAYRSATRSNAIPALFASVLGVASYGVAASAIGEAKDANATDCLKPLAIPDRWSERYPVNSPNSWSAGSTYHRYDPANPAALLPVAQRDIYTAPDQIAAGTGVRMTGTIPNTVWLGAQVTLRQGSIATPISTISPWMYLPVQIPDSRWTPNAVRLNTNSCAAASVAIDDELGIVPGGIAANAALAADGLRDLVAADPNAVWNSVTRRVEGSCAELLVGRCASMSPRVIALPLYDPYQLTEQSHGAGATSVRVRNFVGFFIESVSGTDATGRITTHPGQIDPAAITLYDASSFMRASFLVK